MKKLIICFVAVQFVLMGCTSEVKTNTNHYSTIKNDPLFKEYIERFKNDNIIFSDNSIFFDKIKKKEYFRCYTVLFGSASCDYRDFEPCKKITNEEEFLSIVENKCKKGKLMIELKEKYPEMDKKLLARLIEGSYENGFAAEMLKTKKNNKR